MTADVEKNRRNLRVLCQVGQGMGWALILLAVIYLSMMIWDWRVLLRRSDYMTVIYASFNDIFFNYIFPSLMIFGIVQLIRYLAEEDNQAGWILRRAHLIIYCYAFFRFITLLIGCFKISLFFMNYPLSFFITQLILPFAPILIAIGLGRAIHLILPVIGESKTLA